MKAYEAVRAAAKDSGVPITHIGPALGKSSVYVSNGASRGSIPKADTLASMLSVCGYVLAALPADQVPPSALVIDPADTKPSV